MRLSKKIKLLRNVPDTVSSEAKKYLMLQTYPSIAPPFPNSRDTRDWKKVKDAFLLFGRNRQKRVVSRYKPIIKDREYGGIKVIEIIPKRWKHKDRVLVFLHGGAYVLFSADSSLDSCVPMAEETGLKVVSIDYTTAPKGRWTQVTGEVMAVYKGLLEDGYEPEKIAFYGDSAGGALAAGSILRMRDLGLPLPAALVLWSPWADITDTGDSYTTLAQSEPTFIYELHLKPGADAYADEEDQKIPYVSPVYGDYSKGFPPTLIQGGTKELFLSNFVRLYRAIEDAGQEVKLDLYEGMPHVFQIVIPQAPETKIALKTAGGYILRKLGI